MDKFETNIQNEQIVEIVEKLNFYEKLAKLTSSEGEVDNIKATRIRNIYRCELKKRLSEAILCG